MFLAGLGAALLASVLFNLGLALQALEARDVPRRHGLRVSLVGLLLRRPLWVLGLLLGLAGVLPQIYAFSAAPFAIVQTALTAGLVLLLYLGASRLDEHVGASAAVGVASIVTGIGLLSWGIPHRHDTHRGGLAVIAVVAAVTAVAVLPFALERIHKATTLVIITAAGAGFGATNIATKLLSDDVGLRHWPQALAWGGVALAMGIIATITQMTAFQASPATVVVPTTTALQTFLPIVLEPFFLHESWSTVTAYGIPLILGVVLSAVGVVLVSRTGAVSKLAAAAA